MHDAIKKLITYHDYIHYIICFWLPEREFKHGDEIAPLLPCAGIINPKFLIINRIRVPCGQLVCLISFSTDRGRSALSTGPQRTGGEVCGVRVLTNLSKMGSIES